MRWLRSVTAVLVLLGVFTSHPADASTSVVQVFGSSFCPGGVWTVSVRLTDTRVGGDLVDVWDTHPAAPVKVADSVQLLFGVPVDPAVTFTPPDKKTTVDVVPHGALAFSHIGEWRGARPAGCSGVGA
jgi:hypothetical protein